MYLSLMIVDPVDENNKMKVVLFNIELLSLYTQDSALWSLMSLL